MKFDLHTHTCFSDGELSPEQLIERAAGCGVDVLAITDHDSFKGSVSAVAFARKTGIRLIPGVEMSAKFDGELHILGYNIDCNNAVLAGMMDTMEQSRAEKSKKILALLREHSINISEDEIDPPRDGVVGRVHIARTMIEKGYVSSMSEAFDDYLSVGASCYVQGFKYSAGEIITAINNAGGVAVLAHPKQIAIEQWMLAQFIEGLRECGLGGIEAYYPGHTPADSRMLGELADKLGMITTCGTDFHGSMRGNMNPGDTSGRYMPDENTLEKLGILD